jgi:hypothetical protein
VIRANLSMARRIIGGRLQSHKLQGTQVVQTRFTPAMALD